MPEEPVDACRLFTFSHQAYRSDTSSIESLNFHSKLKLVLQQLHPRVGVHASACFSFMPTWVQLSASSVESRTGRDRLQLGLLCFCLTGEQRGQALNIHFLFFSRSFATRIRSIGSITAGSGIAAICKPDNDPPLYESLRTHSTVIQSSTLSIITVSVT